VQDDEVNDIGPDDIMPTTPARNKCRSKKSTPASSLSEETNSWKKMSVSASPLIPF
jgi:hypothetical protein